MALQTKTVSTAKGGYSIVLTLNQRELNRKNNTSSVSYKFVINAENGQRLMADGYNWNIYIAGQTIPIVDYNFKLSKSDPSRVIASGRLTVQHDVDGKLAMPYAVSVPDVADDLPAMELTGTWDLVSVPRIPKIYCTDGFIGSAVAIRIDPLDQDLTYTLSYAFGALRGTVAEKIPALSLTWGLPQAFYTQIPEAKEATCYLTCKAYSGNTEIGSGSCAFTAKVDPKYNMPTVEATIEDNNPDTVALTGNPGVLVRFCSDARVTGEGKGKNGATVEKYSVNYGGAIFTKSPADIFSVESGEFRFQVTDSRGFTATETVTKEVIPYIKLTCNLGDNKPDGDGDMTLKVSGNYFNGSFGEQSNSLEVKYRYKVAGDTYCDWIPMPTDVGVRSYTAQAKISGLDYKTAYVFQARATDKLWRADSVEYTVRAMPVFDWDENDFNVNGNFRINEETVADFVVSRGKNEIWSWEKWNSGIVKCWGISGEKTYTFAGASTVCHSEILHTYTYPVALTEVLSANVNIISEGFVVPLVFSVAENLQVAAVRLCGGSPSVKGRYSFQVLGRWK